ncbi:MAG: ATP-binding protein [Promethearchaeota archaeon]
MNSEISFTFKSIVNTVRDPLILLDKDLRVISANKSFYETFKVSPEETKNNFLYDLGNGQWDIPELLKLLKNIILINTQFDNFEVSHNFETIGERIMVLNARKLIQEEGKQELILLAIEDKTKYKEYERRLKESEKKYFEAYNRINFYRDLFTHDMNNIFQAILSSSQLSLLYLEKIEKYQKIKESLLFLNKQIKRGISLVDNVQKLSLLEIKKPELNSINNLAVLKKAINHIIKDFQEKTINIEIQNPFEKVYVKANEFLINIFENILINAVIHNNNEIIIILIKISKIEKNGIKYIKMEFLDNGKGISDDLKKEILSKEYGKKKSIIGRGLGLSLIKKILDTYTGEIWIENKILEDHLKGSNIIILIPEVI